MATVGALLHDACLAGLVVHSHYYYGTNCSWARHQDRGEVGKLMLYLLGNPVLGLNTQQPEGDSRLTIPEREVKQRGDDRVERRLRVDIV